ncbi:MAG: alanine racemase, partial [Acidimicrobiales bacterium]
MVEGTRRPTFAEVDLDAVAHNSAVMAGVVAPARLCAVVKADAYGHGAPACAAAALEGGASELAVALVEEGVELREAGIAAPVLVLSEPGPDAMAEAFVHGLTPTLYTASGVAAARRAARSQAAPGRTSPGPTAPGRTPGRWRVEVKLDTGMHRVGASPHELARLVSAVVASDELSFAGLWTHLAVADEPDDPFTKVQLDTLAAARRGLLDAGLPAPGRVHAANSAGGIAWPESRLDLVRCGIAIYGYAPSASVAPLLAGHRLWPALSFKSRVGFVRRLPAGERLSYGLARELPGECFVATVPAGYADGITRAYFD